VCLAALILSDGATIPSRAGGTGILEEAMTSPTFFRLAATLDQLPSFRGLDLWGRFVRWAFWGQHAQQGY